MIWLGSILGYVVVGLLLWRRWAGLLAVPDNPTGSWDWSFGVTCGGVGALVWPIVVLIIILSHFCGRLLAAVSREAHPLVMSRGEREMRLKQREREIARAEEQLGLVDPTPSRGQST